MTIVQRCVFGKSEEAGHQYLGVTGLAELVKVQFQLSTCIRRCVWNATSGRHQPCRSCPGCHVYYMQILL